LVIKDIYIDLYLLSKGEMLAYYRSSRSTYLDQRQTLMIDQIISTTMRYAHLAPANLKNEVDRVFGKV